MNAQISLAKPIASTTLVSGAGTPSCTFQPGPDGKIVSVCEVGPLSPVPTVSSGVQGLDGMPIVNNTTLSSVRPQLLSAGRGTTTLTPNTPYNDVLIAETGSEFASLRNARYTMSPYPGQVKFKEIYLVLPDVYTPIFPGYSNNQFVVSQDGTNQVMLYLQHAENTGMGADTQVYVESPVTTDEADHPMMMLETSSSGVVYSVVKNQEEVIVEVSYKASAGVSAEQLSSAHRDLLHAIEQMEVVW